MKHTRKLIFGFITAFSISAHAAPPAKEATCRTCHGAGGSAPLAPSYPKLNGQNKAYLISSIKAYRDGQRTGGLSAVMKAQSAMLSEADIEELAEYYASQP